MTNDDEWEYGVDEIEPRPSWRFRLRLAFTRARRRMRPRLERELFDDLDRNVNQELTRKLMWGEGEDGE